jgi:hypothetical protein
MVEAPGIEPVPTPAKVLRNSNIPGASAVVQSFAVPAHSIVSRERGAQWGRKLEKEQEHAEGNAVR